MLSLRFPAVAALFLSLVFLPVRPVFAGPGPTSAEAMVDRLALALNLLPTQLPAVQQATVGYVKALHSLDQTWFASAAATSAAYTVVEYEYSRALQQVLTPAQMLAYLELEDSLTLAATKP